MTDHTVAVLVDIVGSRELRDRAGAQRHLAAVFERIDAARPFAVAPYATVGDEFQAESPSVAHAVWASVTARLLFDGVDCRFGIGRGESRTVPNGGTTIHDGPAWWRAREAVEEAHRREDGRTPALRTWFVDEDARLAAALNGQLLIRDDVVARMGARARRLTGGMLLGATQAELAASERISQSAVSQSLRRSGATALLAADQLSDGGAP